MTDHVILTVTNLELPEGKHIARIISIQKTLEGDALVTFVLEDP